MPTESVSPLDVLQRHWVAISAAALISGLVSYAGSYLMTPTYRSEVVIALLNESGNSDLMMALGGQFGGLGALAGLGIGGDSARSERFATLTSRGLAVKFITTEQLVPVFCAAGVIKCQLKSGVGVGEPTERQSNDALKLFQRRVLSVNEDKRTGLVRVSMTWHDRDKAAAWATRFVDLANQELLARSITESDRRIKFLRKAAEAAETVELRQAVYKLMESEIKSRMVSSSRVDYAFKIVDPALVPDARDRVRPKRALLAVLGALVATISFAAILLLRTRRADLGRAGVSAVR